MTIPAALSKADAMAEMTPEVENFLIGAMPKINRMLYGVEVGSSKIVRVTLLDGYEMLSVDGRESARTWIENEYRSKGWTVSFEYGEIRDNGGWFIFS